MPEQPCQCMVHAVHAVKAPLHALSNQWRCRPPEASVRHCYDGIARAQVDIDTVEKFEALQETEKQYFLDMVKQCKDSGANLIICQWCAQHLPLSALPDTPHALFARRPRAPPAAARRFSVEQCASLAALSCSK